MERTDGAAHSALSSASLRFPHCAASPRLLSIALYAHLYSSSSSVSAFCRVYCAVSFRNFSLPSFLPPPSRPNFCNQFHSSTVPLPCLRTLMTDPAAPAPPPAPLGGDSSTSTPLIAACLRLVDDVCLRSSQQGRRLVAEEVSAAAAAHRLHVAASNEIAASELSAAMTQSEQADRISEQASRSFAPPSHPRFHRPHFTRTRLLAFSPAAGVDYHRADFAWRSARSGRRRRAALRGELA